MEYIHDRTDIQLSEPTVLSIGKFDGFHNGHRLLMEQMMKKKQEGLNIVLFTFNLHPQVIVHGTARRARVILTSKEERRLLASSGIDYLIEYPFTSQIRNMEAEVFLDLIVKRLSVKCMVAGMDFHFGKDRQGDVHLLEQCGKKLGFETIILEKKQYRDKDISSTRIRKKIMFGRMEEVAQLLGYPYFLLAPVVHGKRIGSKIGIPTVNQVPPEGKLLPPFGVYVSQVIVDGACYGGITNIGRNPTIADGNPVRIETNIFDFSADLYGKEIEVRFLFFLRPEAKFDTLGDLQEQMGEDVARARTYLDEHQAVIVGH